MDVGRNHTGGMKYEQCDIDNFIKDFMGLEKIYADDDLLYDKRIRGDDFHELIEEYRKRFNVDMTRYLWYFHADEEGNNRGGILFKPPYERVQHIPITPAKLLEFANKATWDISYPNHTLPTRRWDLLINVFLVIVELGWALYSYLR